MDHLQRAVVCPPQGRRWLPPVPANFPATVYVQITRNGLRTDDLLQRGDAVLDAWQRTGSRILEDQASSASTRPGAHLLGL
jgi:hypothetical protein